MFTLIKKRADNLQADKEGPPPEKSGKLSHPELFAHHTALAKHYRAVADEQKAGDKGGINPGAETDSFAGDERSFSNGDQLYTGLSDPEEAGEDPREEATETPAQEAAEEKAEGDTEPSIGLDRHKGGDLRSSNKKGKPLSRFNDVRKKKGGY